MQEELKTRNIDAVILAERIAKREILKKEHHHTCVCSQYCVARGKYVHTKMQLQRIERSFYRYPPHIDSVVFWDHKARIRTLKTEVDILQFRAQKILDELYPIDLSTLAS